MSRITTIRKYLRGISLCIFVMVCFVFLSGIDLSYAKEFTDVSEEHWAKKAIAEMQEKDIISGFPDGSFKPDDPISRAEFAKIITVAFDLKSQDKNYAEVFEDVSPDDWFADYIDCAAPYLTYWETGHKYYYKPDDISVREDIAVALIVASGIYELPLKDTKLLEERFTDSFEISPKLRGTVAKAIENGLIQGFPDDTFKPQSPVTRAEASMLLTRTMKLKEKIADTQKPKKNVENDDPTLEIFPQEEIIGNITKIKGKTEKGNTVLVDGKLAYVNYDGTFEVSISLKPGANNICTQVYNESGKMISKQSIIYMEQTKKLELNVSVPEKVTQQKTIITGKVDDANAKVYINGEIVKPASDGFFSKAIDLKPGNNKIVFKAVNGDGVESKTVKYIEYQAEELQKPAKEFNITAPQKVYENKVLLTGSLGESCDQVYINGRRIYYNNETNDKFAYELWGQLKEGLNTIEIKTVSTDGVTNIKKVNVEYVVTPKEGELTKEKQTEPENSESRIIRNNKQTDDQKSKVKK